MVNRIDRTFCPLGLTQGIPLEKTLMLGKIEGGRRRERQDEMVRWHHRVNRHESEQTPGGGEGQGSLVCCSSWYTNSRTQLSD